MRIFILALLFSIHFTALFAQVFTAKNYPQNYFEWPVGAAVGIVANFGELRPNHYHMGLDCRTDQKENIPVYASAAGYIAKVKIEPYGFGRCIYINHSNGLTTLYAHLNDFNTALEKYIAAQQYQLKSWKVFIDIPASLFPVKKGQFIAYSGNTGGSQGPHTHFEQRPRCLVHARASATGVIHPQRLADFGERRGVVRQVIDEIVSLLLQRHAWRLARHPGSARGLLSLLDRLNGELFSLLQRPPNPQAEMRGDDEPEDDLVTRLCGLVAETLLGKERAGPAAEQFEEMEGVFGNAPFSVQGSGFVRGVGDEGDTAGGSIDRRHPPPEVVKMRGPCQSANKPRRSEEGPPHGWRPARALAAALGRRRGARLHGHRQRTERGLRLPRASFHPGEGGARTPGFVGGEAIRDQRPYDRAGGVFAEGPHVEKDIRAAFRWLDEAEAFFVVPHAHGAAGALGWVAGFHGWVSRQ